MQVLEPAPTRHRPRLPLLSTRDPAAHMPGSKGKVECARTRQRRTLLECMSRRTVLRMLSFLSFHDINNLLCADKRLRPFVNMPFFARWRKQYLKFQECEHTYERHLRAVPTQETPQDQVIDESYVLVYMESLRALHFCKPPLQMHEILYSILQSQSEHFPPVKAACAFVIEWILGRVSVQNAFSRFDHAHAVELLYFLRLFLAVFRLSRYFDTDYSVSQYPQSIHTLDGDCASALGHFFAPGQPVCSSGELTEEQSRFVHYQVRRNDLLCVQAYAGTGKTRSLLAYAKLRPHQRFLYITFNAAAAKSARSVFPPNVDCRTMHSVALRHVLLPEDQELRTLRPRDVVRLLGDRIPEGKRTTEPVHDRSNALAPTTVALYILRTLDRFMQSTDDHIRPDVHIPKNMSLSTDLRAEAIAEATQTLWEMICSNKSRGRMKAPCPHDAYVKLLQLQPLATLRFFAEYNALLLDEAQDLSACQTAILLRARGQCGVIVVGDIHQKIYGFRGGSASAFNARLYSPTATFHLTKSFRFGSQVAALATKVLRLKAPPPWHNEEQHGVWQHPSITGHGSDKVYRDIRAISKPHTRIYRTNALLTRDLLQLSLTLPENEFLFLKTSQNLSHRSIIDLLHDGHRLYHGDSSGMTPNSSLREFSAWKELVEHVEAEDAADGKLTLVLSLQEMIASPDFLAQLEGLDRKFCANEESASIVLTTVHQAKGLEWDSVVMANDFSPSLDACMPFSLQPQVSQLFAQDELNHMYVAITRARCELFIPNCVLQWLVVLDGLFRYRFCEKKRSRKCPQCQQVSSLVQLCEPFAGTLQFDARTETLGCLLCMRSQLSTDDDLHDFVRFIDECGVSTVTGRLTSASITRYEHKMKIPSRLRSKRARLEVSSQQDTPACAGSTALDVLLPHVRAQKYTNMLESKMQSIDTWFTLEQFWLSPRESS